MGAWDFIKYMDYVVYPMNYYFDSGTEEISYDCNLDCAFGFNISVSFGYNDDRGYLATINVGELLLTMTPV